MQTSDGRAHLRALAAAPRPAGGRVEARAREYCRGVLARLGFRTRDEPFEYSAFPGRFATPLVGAASVAALVGAFASAREGGQWIPLATLLGALAVISGAGTWLARRGVVEMGAMRARSVNLVAMRGAAEPRVWLVAHLDSKSQAIPILVRAGGITLLAVVWLVAIGVAIAGWRGAAVEGWWPWVVLVGALAGVPVLLSVVGARSPGAADNASGVAAVLEAAESLEPEIPVAILITSGEELGLAGARCWVRGRVAGLAVNCDTIDDRGALTVMHTGRRPDRLLAAVRETAIAEDVHVRAHRLLPGILTDGVAFADADWEAITISRGGIGTLRRVHSPGDSLESMRGDGITAAARLMAGIARRVCE